MPWVSFEKNFDYRPAAAPRVMISYRAGKTYNVPTPCAELAKASGAAKALTRPRNRRQKPTNAR